MMELCLGVGCLALASTTCPRMVGKLSEAPVAPKPQEEYQYKDDNHQQYKEDNQQQYKEVNCHYRWLRCVRT